MDWSNERYVRLYTRDTVTWRKWSWQARAVFGLLLRKVDRSGVLDTGRDDKAESLALIIDVPTDVAAVVMGEWVASGTVVLREAAIFIPRFLEAQEAGHSDKMRQTESRARRAAATLRTTEDVRHSLSQPVTDGHGSSQSVTPAVPTLPVPTRAVPAVPAVPRRRGARKAEQQQPLIEAPPPPPRPPTRIGKLHEFFLEQREGRYVLPPPYGLEIADEVPPDETPDWGRSAAALAHWLKRWPDDPPEKQDQRIQHVIMTWLEEPYWASPKPDKHTGKVTPFPWGAFISGDQFAKACAKGFPEEVAA